MKKKSISINSIKQLTSQGSYNVSTPIGHLVDKIKDWTASSKSPEKGLDLQLCPDFQRGHVWTEEQQIAFVEFILRGGKTTPIQFNHPNWMGSFQGEFVCVDGLQRITALMKFLENKLPVFDGIYLEDFSDKDLLLRRYDIYLSVNNLKTRSEVLNWYLELNSGGTPHTKEEIEKVQKMLDSEKK